MKIKIFFLSLLCINVLTYSQTTITINNSAGTNGYGAYLDNSDPLNPYYSLQTGNVTTGKITVGKIDYYPRWGRGFLSFSLFPSLQDATKIINEAKFVFDTKAASSNGSHEVKFGKPSSVLNNSNAETAFNQIGNSTIPFFTKTLSANTNDNEVTIDPQIIIDAYNNSNNLAHLYVGLLHSDEKL